MNQVDLHLHSCLSDSSLSVADILAIVKKQKLKAFSITDHDTFAAYEQIKSQELPCPLIKGIEISTMDALTNQSVHILGYGFSKDTPHITALCEKTLRHVQEQSLWQIQQLQAHGYAISLEEVKELAKDSTAIYKQHILQALVNHGYMESIYAALYQTLFKNQGICHAKLVLPRVEEAIHAIHADHGIAVLAHPFASHMEHDLERMYQLGINGVEVYHSSHDQHMVAFLHAFAKDYRLIETGGSDAHGCFGNEPMIGVVNPFWEKEENCLCNLNYWKQHES